MSLLSLPSGTGFRFGELTPRHPQPFTSLPAAEPHNSVISCSWHVPHGERGMGKNRTVRRLQAPLLHARFRSQAACGGRQGGWATRLASGQSMVLAGAPLSSVTMKLIRNSQGMSLVGDCQLFR